MTACLLDDEPLSEGEEPSLSDLGEADQAIAIPARGSATTLDLASWNLEWFGDAGNGPSNEALQLSNARDVIAGTDFDIWGLEEIVSTTSFNSLVAQLPGYAGFLANDPSVVDGPAYYSDFGNTEQKVGLLYKSSVATVLGARIILTQLNSDFAGRPPMEVRLRVSLNGGSEDVVVIVMHPKCCTDSTSYQRRVNASNGLKAYLDSTYPTQKVWVIGDYNDDVDTSISSGRTSPYQNFVSDSARYTVVSKALSDARISSTVGFPDTIDHHTGTNEAAATYVAGSVDAYRVDAFLSSYGTTTSDHFPVLSRYTFAGNPTTPTLAVTAPSGGSYVVGSALNITWTSSQVANVRLEYSVNGGGAWSLITASTPASVGAFAWTAPSTPTTAGLVRISDTASTLSAVSASPFAITAAGGTANVIVNEILANEPGSATAGEFIELVNIGTAAADLSSWTLSDRSRVRHRFAAGTTLAAGQAIVVFGGASAIPGQLTNAVAASTGTLALGNGGDTVTLRDAASAVLESFSYTSALSSVDGVSMNRNPDGAAGAPWVLHSSIAATGSSPGTRASGAAW
ncbi:MAG: lamin tail domain-containing protein [Kofleriaceae bacterium]